MIPRKGTETMQTIIIDENNAQIYLLNDSP